MKEVQRTITIEFNDEEFYALQKAVELVNSLALHKELDDDWNEMFPWSSLPLINDLEI